VYCPNCGSRNRDDARFCGNCATRLVPPESPDPPVRPAPTVPGSDAGATQAYPPGYLSGAQKSQPAPQFSRGHGPESPGPQTYPPAQGFGAQDARTYPPAGAPNPYPSAPGTPIHSSSGYPAGYGAPGHQAAGYPPPFAPAAQPAYPYRATTAAGAPPFRLGIRQIVALAGSVLLLVSLLCPIEIRADEYINYWNTAEGKAILLLGILCIAVTAVSAVGSLPSWTIMGVWVGAGAALAVTIYNLIQVHGSLPSDISLGWGWGAAIVGALVVVIAPLIPEPTPAQRGPTGIR